MKATQRIAFRRILPVVDLACGGILIVLSRLPTDRLDLWCANRWFEVLNWPGAAASFTLLATLSSHAPRIADIPGLGVVQLTAFLALQWYLVGLWVDRRLRLAPRRDEAWPKKRRQLFYLGLVVVFAMLCVHHLQGYPEAHRKIKHLALSLVVWSGIATMAYAVELFESFQAKKPVAN